MKKISIIIRETTENRIKNFLSESESVFVVTYSKVSSPDLCNLRQSLRGSNATLFVTKNSVARRALKNSALENITPFIQGPCGLIFIKDEPVGVSKILCEFVKAHEQLKLEGGIFKDKVINVSDIQNLAKLPPKEILRTQLVIGLKSPIFNIVMVLKGNLRKVVYCLQQIKDKKGK